MSGAITLAKRIASMLPAGKAGLKARMVTVRKPMRMPYAHLPGVVAAADTGSVAMKTMPKNMPPMTRS